MIKIVLDLKAKILAKYQENFIRADEIAEINTEKILNAMRELKISDAHFKNL